MNECFLLAKRITDLNFKFIINRKEKSIVKFRAQLLNHSEIELFAYDELADYIYQKDLSIFLVRGEIRTNMQIEIVEIFNWKIATRDVAKWQKIAKKERPQSSLTLNKQEASKRGTLF